MSGGNARCSGELDYPSNVGQLTSLTKKLLSWLEPSLVAYDQTRKNEEVRHQYVMKDSVLNHTKTLPKAQTGIYLDKKHTTSNSENRHNCHLIPLCTWNHM